MWQVLENGIPCKYPDYDIHPSWKNNEFKTFRAARDYANMWLGQWRGGFVFSEKNNKLCYNEEGDVVSIEYVPESKPELVEAENAADDKIEADG